MMIKAVNVNEGFVDAIWQMRVSGAKEDSRNGEVMSLPHPIMITYLNPRERILWEPRRDANPFFHLLESLWMLAGRDDSEYVAQFNSRMKEYAEGDGRIHGAYGMRWRYAYGIDQIRLIIDELKRTPTSRRAVLAMWYATADLSQDYRDVPCNTHAYFRIREHTLLDMTVCNRSNDLLWGTFGANAAHFSMLQEFLANAMDLGVGYYHQFTNNLHAYTDLPMMAGFLEQPPRGLDLYHLENITPYPCLTTPDGWEHFLEELPAFLNRQYAYLTQPFLLDVAMPMQEFYLRRKEGNEDMNLLHDMVDCDWKSAALQWVARRNLKAQDRAGAAQATSAQGPH